MSDEGRFFGCALTKGPVKWFSLDMDLEQRFAQEIARHQGIIHQVCRLYAVGEANRQDLFQEIVLQLWRAYPAYRGEAKISTWMYRIALNTAISGLRKARRQVPSQPLTPVLADQLAADSPPPLEGEDGRLHRAIQRLSKVDRALVMLYLEDHSYEEIAAITGLTPNHVGVKLHRIKARLRAWLTPSPSPTP